MEKIALLTSGGIDSSVLIAKYAQSYTVFPIYVSCGFIWEQQEQTAITNYLDALQDSVQPLTVLTVNLEDAYQSHWSSTGRNTPMEGTSDLPISLKF